MLDLLQQNIQEKSIQKAISEYRHLYEISPKKINRRIFQNYDTPPLDSLTNMHNNV
jgi:hypothetical protein